MNCQQCHRTLPVGYLPVVTEWKSVEWGKDYNVQLPKKASCRECIPDPVVKPRKPVVHVAGDLPFRPSSLMRSLVEAAIKGITKNQLKIMCEVRESAWEPMYKVLLSGGPGHSKTHKWKPTISPEGVIRVVNLEKVS